MPSAEPRGAMNGDIDADSVHSVCEQVRDTLEEEKERVFAEIRNYPPPIPACDLQFNRLLERRAQVSQELTRLQILSAPTPVTDIKPLDEFIASSIFIDDEAKRRIRASLKKALSTLEK